MTPKKVINRVIRIFLYALLFCFVSSLLAVVAYRWLPVSYTPLMVIRAVEQKLDGRPAQIDHQWVPLDSISHQLVDAVVASEDNRFLSHNGFDFEEIYKARLTALHGGKERGASTITQQTAKNVFLWPAHSWVRKGLEAYFTVLIEKLWGKKRIMEVYLNSIEMGDGVYGAQAVAKANFGKDASALTRREAALIAATLPDPLHRDSANPTGGVLKRRNAILKNMRALPSTTFDD